MMTIESVYRAADALITALKSGGHVELASVLDHRLHKVAWTSGSELLEELRGVLSEALGPGSASKSTLPTEQIRALLRTIEALEVEGSK